MGWNVGSMICFFGNSASAEQYYYSDSDGETVGNQLSFDYHFCFAGCGHYGLLGRDFIGAVGGDYRTVFGS